MRQITRDIVDAFQNSRSLKIGNSRTNGESLWLFDNKIAEIRRDGLWITNAGWDSRTTYERLNGLSGVHVRKQRGTLLLNDRVWDGRWVHVGAWDDGIEYVNGVSVTQTIEPEIEFDMTSEWVYSGGYSRPIYAVAHTLVKSELESVEAILDEHGIKHRRMESDTERMYKPNYFVIVRPNEHQMATWLVGVGEWANECRVM